jgi:ferredoxin--NADP+ reductase
VLDVDTVIFCIGDKVDERFGLPVEWNEFVKSSQPHYAVDGLSFETPVPGVFVAGWSRKASEGLVGYARKDGENGARAVLQYLQEQTPHADPEAGIAALEAKLRQAGAPVVTKEDWQRLEMVEQQEAEKRHLELFKFNSNEEMLAAMGLSPVLER